MDSDRCSAPVLACPANSAPTRYEGCRTAEVTLLHAEGEVDIGTADEFVATIRARLGASRRVVVDLGGVTFMSAGGVSACLAAQREGRAVDCEVAFTNAQGIVGRVLDVLDVEQTLAGWIARP